MTSGGEDLKKQNYFKFIILCSGFFIITGIFAYAINQNISKADPTAPSITWSDTNNINNYSENKNQSLKDNSLYSGIKNEIQNDTSYRIKRIDGTIQYPKVVFKVTFLCNSPGIPDKLSIEIKNKNGNAIASDKIEKPTKTIGNDFLFSWNTASSPDGSYSVVVKYNCRDGKIENGNINIKLGTIYFEDRVIKISNPDISNSGVGGYGIGRIDGGDTISDYTTQDDEPGGSGSSPVSTVSQYNVTIDAPDYILNQNKVQINVAGNVSDALRADLLISDVGSDNMHLKCSVGLGLNGDAIYSECTGNINNFSYDWDTSRAKTNFGMHHIIVLYWGNSPTGNYATIQKSYFDAAADKKTSVIVGMYNETERREKYGFKADADKMIYVGEQTAELTSVVFSRSNDGKLRVEATGSGDFDSLIMYYYPSDTKISKNFVISLDAQKKNSDVKIPRDALSIQKWVDQIPKEYPSPTTTLTFLNEGDIPDSIIMNIYKYIKIDRVVAFEPTGAAPTVQAAKGGKANSKGIQATAKTAGTGGTDSGSGTLNPNEIAEQFGWGTMITKLKGLSKWSNKEPLLMETKRKQKTPKKQLHIR
ncbi:MAG: hypothetical protein CEN91_260 [Candidatus Berkelbacteria bacterium Licking1014_85]|uniref:Uncharacterized protein n=1 Tax=Candidatus Berkelbacteria bacterium Licking1014_85 TaxID=2017148 RepID=A0A554LKA3_9BACT|nr:MAG: hypothetical protein CEN91_260 [Candidatus Berkelbacteria bacterium Licking1014_85]